jgi:integrase
MLQRSFSAKSPPKKCWNRERRAREYLTPIEVDHLIRAARQRSRYGDRGATLLLLMYRHGLRVAEAVHLRWDMLGLKAAVLHVRRLKQGVAAVHPLRGSELRALRQLQQTHAGMAYLFISERGGRSPHVRCIISWPKLGSQRGCLFPSTPTCCGMRADFTRRIKGSIHMPCNSIWGIGTSNIWFATVN